MATEPFLINPQRGRTKKATRRHPWNWQKKLTNWGKVKTHRRHVNPFGEEVMIVGNPRRRRHSKRRGMRNIFLNPFRSRKRSRSRRNPATGLPAVSLQRPASLLPVVITGGAAVVATAAAPRLLGPYIGDGPIQRYGSQLFAAFGGGWAINRFVGRSHATVWTIVSLATIGGQLLNEYVVGPSGLLGLGAYLGVGDEYDYAQVNGNEDLDSLAGDSDLEGDEFY